MVFPEDGLVVELVEVVAPDPVVGVGSQDVLVITPVAKGNSGMLNSDIFLCFDFLQLRES